MKHALLFGNGFVGKVAADLLRQNSWKVTTVSRGGEADVHADVSSVDSLRELKEQISTPTHIVHCASASGGGVEVYRQVYAAGCHNLVKLFPSIPILFTSSTSVYPQVDGSTVTEDTAIEMERETGKVLLEAESAVLQADGIVARLAGVYGNGRSYLLGRFLAGQATMEEDGSRILNHTHHHDAASAILHLLEKKSCRGQIYNVCDSHPKSQRETYLELTEVFSKPMALSVARNTHSKRGWSNKAVSNAKILASGWQPTYPEFTRVAQEISLTL